MTVPMPTVRYAIPVWLSYPVVAPSCGGICLSKVGEPITMPELPKGIRLNNPGNMAGGGPIYQGELLPSKDPKFMTFVSIEFGLRAMGANLLAYRHRHGCKAIHDYVTRWAPPVENLTDAYISDVAAYCHVDATADYPLTETSMPLLLRAISHHENGGEYVTPEQAQAAATMLFTSQGASS